MPRSGGQLGLWLRSAGGVQNPSSSGHYLSVSLSPVDCYCQHLLIYTLRLLNPPPVYSSIHLSISLFTHSVALRVDEAAAVPLSDQQECIDDSICRVYMSVTEFPGVSEWPLIC
ncbi:unnamed protein product [Leuciscus chuanchicus]